MIKLFEEYNQYYTEIDKEEFNNLYRKAIPFTKDESMYLYRHETKIETNTRWGCTDPYKKNIFVFIYYTNPKTYIYKLPDEWFVAEYGNKFYKCDQLEGLMKCLDDLP